MFKNRRGFTGIEIAVVLVAIGIIGYFAVPPAIKAAGTLFSGGDKSQQKMTHAVTESEQYAMFYKDERGNFKPAPTPYIRKRTETGMNYTSEPIKDSMLDVLKKWAFLIGALCLIFPAFGIWIFKRFLDMKNNFKQLVTGIEEAKKELPPESITKLETNLSKKMDTGAKKLVKEVKVKL